ncbi:hypothetical protein SAMN05216276_100432 [Streptosporangium subroseum]|uniref:Uncharacterized protein n=2 Tax=Streptosporangium subroseum TaxID=106412 RepID=A0A239BN83_9ACTN|nr:hypothetical protein SAMN05216276_100432 [Streptosporangium subroseum]
MYALLSADVAGLPRTTRRILTDVIAVRGEPLAEPHEAKTEQPR